MARLRRPTTLDEALAMLADGEAGPVTPIAGGIGISLAMALGGSAPTDVVAIGHLDELRAVERDGGDIVLGAALTIDELARGAARGVPPLLAAGAAQVANPGIRTVGTVAGNLVAGGPASDLVAALLALGATLDVVGRDGMVARSPVDRPPPAGTLVRGIRVSAAAAGWGWGWERLTIRGAMDRSSATVAATLTPDGPRVALSVAPVRPGRLRGVEAAAGPAVREAAIADLAAIELRPDDRVSVAYRRRVIPVLVQRAVRAASSS
jgi:CO/xanthine dehydrogenase FAD-binding subunit